MAENNIQKQFLDSEGLNVLWNKICSIFASKDELEEAIQKIDGISSGLKVTASVSPTIIYKGTATNVNVTATVKDNSGNYTAESIVIKSGSTELKTATNVATTSYTDSVNITADEKTYTISATALGMSLNTSISVNARYPVFYGMGTSAADVKANGTKATARTTAVSTTAYNATAITDGVRFYLLVPSDVTRPSSFTMGGAPVDMHIPSSSETLDGISYYVFYTNATYNSGASVQIKAN